ncbi:MAG: hypothetical protein C0498_14275 [Anaerolinea sp.]|jgi:hypothetical protein|nr:hypothetical protein [Anaerolinea sp.]
MKRFLILAAVAVLTVGALGTVSASEGESQRKDVKATLSGFAEVPSISTAGTGKLRLRIDPTNTTISYELTYSGLEGGAVTGAHLHLGQAGVDGGAIAFLCNGGGTNPACAPAAGGTMSGAIVAANILPLPAQGIAGPTPAEFAEVLKAIRAGVVYANVHTASFPDGEIRGQLKPGKS